MSHSPLSLSVLVTVPCTHRRWPAHWTAAEDDPAASDRPPSRRSGARRPYQSLGSITPGSRPHCREFSRRAAVSELREQPITVSVRARSPNRRRGSTRRDREYPDPLDHLHTVGVIVHDLRSLSRVGGQHRRRGAALMTNDARFRLRHGAIGRRPPAHHRFYDQGLQLASRLNESGEDFRRAPIGGSRASGCASIRRRVRTSTPRRSSRRSPV